MDLSEVEEDAVNMSRVSSMDTLTAYFDNTLSNFEVLDGNPCLPDIDALLASQPPALFTADSLSSHEDNDVEYQDFSSFEEIPPLDDDNEDTDDHYHDHDHEKNNSSCSEVDEHENDPHGPKKYRQPACLRATNLTIGPWKLNDPTKAGDSSEPYNLEVKFLFGRKKIKYELTQGSSKKILLMDYDFSQISALKFKSKEKVLTFQLSEPPTFSAKERGKCNKVADFTQNNASHYQRHIIELSTRCDEQVERLLCCDKRLRQLSEIGLPAVESTFNDDKSQIITATCDWDKENSAVVFCAECRANYCEDCDDVLHRHSTRKHHKRVPISSALLKPKKSKKRKKSDRCRCGTGATKGTLGDPCTGNRCPCYSSGKGCSNCGCKNCNNPYKKGHQRESSLGNDVNVTTVQV